MVSEQGPSRRSGALDCLPRFNAAELVFSDYSVEEIAVQEGSDNDDEDHYEDEEEHQEETLLEDVPCGNDKDDADNGFDENADETDEDLNAASDPDPYDVSTDEDIDEDYNSGWTKNLRDFPHIPPFTGDTGIKVDLGEDPTPFDVYQQFLTDDIIHHIKRQTNKYARSEIDRKTQEVEASGEQLSRRSLYITWQPVTVAEVWTFLAITIHIGLVKKPQLTDYWSKHPALHTSYAANLMTRERYIAILMFLHVADNEEFVPRGQPGHDPIHKIRPFVTHLQRRFEAVYYPQRNICINEAMCPFKGRSRFRVYMKDKPTKWGFKFYELCESGSGYVSRFEMFCAHPLLSNKPFDVVCRLIQPLLLKGHHLYIDNYYCEPKICQYLAVRDTMVCGTVKSNCVGMPRELTTGNLQPGMIDFHRCGHVVAVRWRDKKDVYVLSTMHKPKLELSQARFELKRKPQAVIQYIANMAGVDQSDQLISYFPMHRKSCKWWKKPFFYLLSLVMIQTMVILNKHRAAHNRKLMSLEDVVKSVCLDLPATDVQPVDVAGAGPARKMVRLVGRKDHFPAAIPQTGALSRPYRNCKVCFGKSRAAGQDAQTVKSRRKQTPWWCPDCQTALCIDPCFRLYHTVDDYTK